MFRDHDEHVAAPGRRRFFRQTALTAGALSALAAIDLSSASPAEAAGDADILNFALNLEYLEAEFYLRAAFGRGLRSGDVGSKPGAVKGGKKVPFKTKEFANYAVEIAKDEENHVQFLRKALGGAAVSRPALDLDTAFTAAAQAAGLIKKGQKFDAFANENNFLLAAYIFEDVGVTAYFGAATAIKSKTVLDAAARIGAVEAYHAGEIRTLLYGLGLFSQTQAISDLRDEADGPGMADMGIGNRNVANIVLADSNSLAYTRDTDQVLRIVYLGGRAKGGFFPNGLNGAIA